MSEEPISMEELSEAVDESFATFRDEDNIWEKMKKAMEDKEKSVRQRMKVAQKYYSKSLPYMEKFRALEPKEEKRWKPILYDIYLNLNMGKEFKAIQKGQN